MDARMLTIKAEQNIFDKLKEILNGEDEGACIRLREYNIGSG